MNLTEIGLRIKNCRKTQGITQEKLAEKINVSPHYIYELERGLKSMSVSTLMVLAASLHTSTDYLLFGTSSGLPDSKTPTDNLDILLTQLSPQKRESVATIIEVALPLLK